VNPQCLRCPVGLLVSSPRRLTHHPRIPCRGGKQREAVGSKVPSAKCQVPRHATPRRATRLVSGSTKNTLSSSSARSLHFCEMSGRYTDPRVRSEMASESFWSWDWPWGWSQSGGELVRVQRKRGGELGDDELGDVLDVGSRCHGNRISGTGCGARASRGQGHQDHGEWELMG
jgi:hypothetical protein